MARNVSSRFSLDEGFEQEIKKLHSDSSENSDNSVNSVNGGNSVNSGKDTGNTRRVRNAGLTPEKAEKSGSENTASVENTNSVNSANSADSAAGTAAAAFDPAAEAEFIAKSCLYDESKTKRITIQFNRDIYDYIKRESRVRGLSINNFVRMIILSYMSVPGNKHYVD